MTEQHIQTFPEVLSEFPKQFAQELALQFADFLSTLQNKHNSHAFTSTIRALDNFGSSNL